MKSIKFNDRTLVSISHDTDERYSHNLWLWMKKRNPAERKTVVCLKSEKGNLFLGFQWNGYKGSTLYVDRVSSIIRHGGAGRPLPLTHINEGGMEEQADFWGRYETVGICAVDPEHRAYYKRWLIDPVNKVRSCRYCGNFSQVQAQLLKFEVVERWVSNEREVDQLEDQNHAAAVDLLADHLPHLLAERFRKDQ